MSPETTIAFQIFILLTLWGLLELHTQWLPYDIHPLHWMGIASTALLSSVTIAVALSSYRLLTRPGRPIRNAAHSLASKAWVGPLYALSIAAILILGIGHNLQQGTTLDSPGGETRRADLPSGDVWRQPNVDHVGS